MNNIEIKIKEILGEDGLLVFAEYLRLRRKSCIESLISSSDSFDKSKGRILELDHLMSQLVNIRYGDSENSLLKDEYKRYRE